MTHGRAFNAQGVKPKNKIFVGGYGVDIAVVEFDDTWKVEARNGYRRACKIADQRIARGVKAVSMRLYRASRYGFLALIPLVDEPALELASAAKVRSIKVAWFERDRDSKGRPVRTAEYTQQYQAMNCFRNYVLYEGETAEVTNEDGFIIATRKGRRKREKK